MVNAGTLSVAFLAAAEGTEQVANPDQLRTDPEAVEFARSFFAAGKPVAVRCQDGPNLLVTSRNPGDLNAFCEVFTQVFGLGTREGN